MDNSTNCAAKGHAVFLIRTAINCYDDNFAGKVTKFLFGAEKADGQLQGQTPVLVLPYIQRVRRPEAFAEGIFVYDDADFETCLDGVFERFAEGISKITGN